MSERQVSVKRLIDNSVYEKLMEDSKKYQELLKKNHEQKDNNDDPTVALFGSLSLSNFQPWE